MTALKCDRCGKLYMDYTGLGPDYDTHEITSIIFGNKNFRSDVKDLCFDCAKSFVLWFRDPALGAIANEGD